MSQNAGNQNAPMIRPDAIDKLPFLSAKEKGMFSAGLASLWAVLDDTNPSEDPGKKVTARTKIQEVSRDLMIRMAKQNSGGARPPSQGIQQQQQQQQQSTVQSDATQAGATVQASAGMQNARAGPQAQQPPAQNNQAPQQAPQVSAAVLNVISNFRIYPPSQIHPQNNAAEYDKYRHAVRTRLQQCLTTSERCVQRQKEIAAQEQKMQQAGSQLPAELLRQKEQLPRMIASAQGELASIKAENERNKAYWASLQSRPDAIQQQQQRNVDSSQQATQQGVNMPNDQAAQPGQNVMQQAQPIQTQATQRQQPGANVGARPPSGGQQYNVPAGALNQQTGLPQALSQQAAMNAVSRTYSEQNVQQMPQQRPPSVGQQGALTQQPGQQSQSQSQPQSARSTPGQSSNPNQSFPPANMPSQTTVNQKMPIPAKLNVMTPTPVSMASSRPTLGGLGGGGAPGMMGQPALAKPPGFTLEGESERVLSKKKLDELVRQVTGGGEGDALTPDVEEVC